MKVSLPPRARWGRTWSLSSSLSLSRCPSLPPLLSHALLLPNAPVSMLHRTGPPATLSGLWLRARRRFRALSLGFFAFPASRRAPRASHPRF